LDSFSTLHFHVDDCGALFGGGEVHEVKAEIWKS
jgi:hypothetical protein